MSLQLFSAGVEQTERIGHMIGRRLKGGEVIELVSDLGGGKTAMVRGIAAGMGSADRVASPSFTISRVYKASKLELHHFDFYRLQEAGIMVDELADLLQDPSIVIAVEWAQIVDHVLPADHLRIEITYTGEDSRNIFITVPSTYEYVTANEDLNVFKH